MTFTKTPKMGIQAEDVGLETNSTQIQSDSKYIQPHPTLPPVPDGMSKSQWKKKWKKLQYEANKHKYAKIRREKKLRGRAAYREKIKAFVDRGEKIPADMQKAPKVKANQKDSGINIILDCSFDDLMNEKEIVSLSTQISRAYSSNRRENYFANIKVTSFNKRLKDRFDNVLKGSNYHSWNHIEFIEDEALPTENVVYLTADTNEVLHTLEPGMTYIVGGIVDKNRHKNICYDKATKLSIPTKRLPIDEYVKLSGRKVLTSTHVIQLMLKYFSTENWKTAFEAVLPRRKLEASNEIIKHIKDPLDSHFHYPFYT